MRLTKDILGNFTVEISLNLGVMEFPISFIFCVNKFVRTQEVCPDLNTLFIDLRKLGLQRSEKVVDTIMSIFTKIL